jgi:hypothetical protein
MIASASTWTSTSSRGPDVAMIFLQLSLADRLQMQAAVADCINGT